MSRSTFDIHTNYAVCRWGRGRLQQLAVKAFHELTSHDWGQWNVEPPEDELGRILSPEPDSLVFCFRACKGGCGAVQDVTIPFAKFTELSHVRNH